MLTGLIHTHSLLRYFILIALVVVIVNSLIGMMNRKPFGTLDNKFSLYLLIFTHLQLVVGLAVYLIELFRGDKLVHFNETTMQNASLRYWAVEHITGMLIAIVLITIARISSKKLADDTAKHKRLFILNLLALAIIVITISIGDRGLLTMGVR